MSRPGLRMIEGGGSGSGAAVEASGVVGVGESTSAASGPELWARPGRPACAESHARTGRGLLSAAIATAGAWLVEPTEATEAGTETAAHAPTVLRPVIAVFGLARGAGGTVVARALAAELAARDASGTAAVACEAHASGIPLATQAASRLARALEDVPGAVTRAVGRLCLIEGADHGALADSSRYLAPLVLDAGSTGVGGTPASVADRTILVTTPALEPALARVAAGCLARVGAAATVVVNRARADGDSDGAVAGDRPWSEGPPDVHQLPESRLGAQLALGGREARGDLGRAIAMLADRCEGVA